MYTVFQMDLEPEQTSPVSVVIQPLPALPPPPVVPVIVSPLPVLTQESGAVQKHKLDTSTESSSSSSASDRCIQKRGTFQYYVYTCFNL